MEEARSEVARNDIQEGREGGGDGLWDFLFTYFFIGNQIK